MYKLIYKVTDGLKCCLKSPHCVGGPGSDLAGSGWAPLILSWWFAPLQREVCAVALFPWPIQHQLALAALSPQSMETLLGPR